MKAPLMDTQFQNCQKTFKEIQCPGSVCREAATYHDAPTFYSLWSKRVIVVYVIYTIMVLLLRCSHVWASVLCSFLCWWSSWHQPGLHAHQLYGECWEQGRMWAQLWLWSIYGGLHHRRSCQVKVPENIPSALDLPHGSRDEGHVVFPQEISVIC